MPEPGDTATMQRLPARGGLAGEPRDMSVTRSAIKNEPVARATSQMQPFVWEGTDKRGVKMKGEQQAKNVNVLRAELRKHSVPTPAW